MAKSVVVLNGPNLNMLGNREQEIYGSETLSDIEKNCQLKATSMKLALEFRQTNSEGELVEWIQKAGDVHNALIINAGAYTHTSIAILDSLRLINIPVIEVHLSNISNREQYRKKSFVSQAADGVICGFGGKSYELALEATLYLIK